MESKRITHAFAPVFDCQSRVLVLGTMPSPKSRELGFYYSHPRNRFWPVMAKIFGEEIPKSPEEKRSFCLRHKVALWDVLKECDIEGASDSSIKNAVPNDISVILNSADIKAVFTTGATAAKLYHKFMEPKTGIAAIALPSTSPANAKIGIDELCEEYRKISDYLV
ncbi:MAG: DNA-deoxyinosine glycosylase [Oscillospiraceae bacterium]|nr:DNA-deoxyinosine glycosylase [Oscillospiraceae bacterium]